MSSALCASIESVGLFCSFFSHVYRSLWTYVCYLSAAALVAAHLPHCNTLQPTATYCNILQQTATHCNTLQHITTHCNTHVVPERGCTSRSSSTTLQHTAIHCNTLPHTATHCNTHVWYLSAAALLAACLHQCNTL